MAYAQEAAPIAETVVPEIVVPEAAEIKPVSEPVEVKNTEDSTNAPEAVVETTDEIIAEEKNQEESPIATEEKPTETIVNTEVPIEETLENIAMTTVEEFVKPAEKSIAYFQMMRDLRQAKSADFFANYDAFVSQEKDRLATLPVSADKAANYFSFLERQKNLIGDSSFLNQAKEELEIKIPKKPSSFNAKPEETTVEKMFLNPEYKPEISAASLNVSALRLASISEELLPVADDVKEDGEEVKINSAVRDLASSLNHNPVEIFNYVKNNIDFEPYYGARKGSVGCLEEKVCNDIDTASLTIALMRAAGIPARYKKGVAVMKIDQLEKLLGIESADGARTVYFAFKGNGFPIHLVSGNEISENLDEADFSNETKFGLEWVYPEIFYEYDERGANIFNELNFSEADTTEEVRAILANKPKKQWIPLEPALKTYARAANEIVSDTANLNVENFWRDFLRYQGEMSPTDKYASDLLATTGKDIRLAQYQSIKTLAQENFETLPCKTPYVFASGTDSAGNPILVETWSKLPNDRRFTITISLLKAQDESQVFSHTFFGSEINNIGLDLGYQGATEADQQIIDSYGGIHATPALLVNITPYLEGGSIRAEGQIPIAIGDSLIMQFEYNVRGASARTSQKFSVAGNSEGVYIALSKVQDDPSLDDSSKILLQGNAALAGEYIVKTQEAGELLEKSLDHETYWDISRAVVTQNRVLARTEGVPTAFEFSGLTIDSEFFIHDFSNVGNYKDHQKDFRLLSNEYGSYYESQLFSDVAGLEGISTVKGLQYAYANPGVYTVHVIDSNNESMIDSLALSDNTKANMHADVQNGNTIITPDKPVEQNQWRGILYISLKDDWTGTYAIGEQVGNGGWTTVVFDNIELGRFKNEGTDRVFIFSDHSANSKGKVCNISKLNFLSVLNNENWVPDYGLPCLIEDFEFGDHRHKLILTLDAAKFISQTDNYSLWKKENEIINIFRQSLPDEIIKNDNVYVYWGTFSYAGNNPHWDKQEKIDKLVIFNPKDLSAYVIPDKKIVQKYISSNLVIDKFVPNHLGFPVSNLFDASESFAKSLGRYQNFLNGQIYLKDNLWLLPDKVSVVFGKMAEYYNSDDNMVGGRRGSGGILGFPNSDPYRLSLTEELEQKFERGILKEDGGIFDLIGYNEHERRTNNKEYGIKLADKVFKGEITNIEAMASIANHIAFVTENVEDFVKDFTIFYLGVEKITEYQKTDKVISGVKKYSPTYFWSDTGFKFKFNDSHYCMLDADELKVKELSYSDMIWNYYNFDNEDFLCISNQPFHSMAGFNLGFFYSFAVASLANHFHDANYNPFGIQYESLEDIWLGDKMAYLGDLLRKGFVDKDDVGDWLLEHIADYDLSSERKSVAELVKETEYRKWFRIFEYSIGTQENIFDYSKWKYLADINKFTCNNKVYYYQNYQTLYTEQTDLGKTKAIWDDDSEKMILLYGEVLNTFNTEELICNNFNFLLDNHGMDLFYIFPSIANISFDY